MMSFGLSALRLLGVFYKAVWGLGCLVFVLGCLWAGLGYVVLVWVASGLVRGVWGLDWIAEGVVWVIQGRLGCLGVRLSSVGAGLGRLDARLVWAFVLLVC